MKETLDVFEKDFKKLREEIPNIRAISLALSSKYGYFRGFVHLIKGEPDCFGFKDWGSLSKILKAEKNGTWLLG